MFRKLLPSTVRLLAAPCGFGQATRSASSWPRIAACVGLTGVSPNATRSFMASSTMRTDTPTLPASGSWLYGVPHPNPPVLEPENMAELLVTCIG
eukprot:9036393-Pyramimonas_sp.AAC.1